MIVDIGYPGYRVRENDDHTLTLVYEATGNVCRDHTGREITFSAVGATRQSLRDAADRQDDYLAGLHETLTELLGRERWIPSGSAEKVGERGRG